jgi:rhodanese-related sulfurtransferase
MRSSKVFIPILAILSWLFIIGLNGGCSIIAGDAEITTTSAILRVGNDVTATEAYNLVQANTNNPDFVIIDVRTASEYTSGHLMNAINIDYYSDNFTIDINKLSRDDAYLIYCRTGARSSKAREIMENLGFLSINNMVGGITAWMEQGFTVVKD